MVKFALFAACLTQGPGLPAATNVYDRAPAMTASLSPGSITQKQGTTKQTTITTSDFDLYKLWYADTDTEVIVSVRKDPTVNAALQSAASGAGTFDPPYPPSPTGIVTRVHSNVLKSPGTLSQIVVVDTFNVVDLDTDTDARDASIQLAQIVTITKN